MYNKQVVVDASHRITKARMRLTQRYPFFGKLILRMKVQFGDCGTACTDMNIIMFDIGFMRRLNDAQLEFILLHEVMHCVLKHCIRGKGKLPLVYNIACDIVVNSFILETIGLPEFSIDGESVMHLAPDHTEGRLHTAEEVYNMLIQPNNPQMPYEINCRGSLDNHELWGSVEAQEVSDRWDKCIREAASAVGGKNCSRIPGGLRRYLDEVIHTPKTNWRQLLQDFIRFDRSDYDFTVPDRRYQSDFLLPSFRENIQGDSVKGLWLFVDASGSISDLELAVLMKEIYSAYEHIENISGKLSFFDTDVSQPSGFESFDELSTIKPVGGGGTSFKSVFEYLKTINEDELPELILIFTDGYADFPEEDAAMGIPVVWLIIDSDIKPPWGNTINIHS